MADIGFKTLEKAKTMLCAQLDEYHAEIDKAYTAMDGKLPVALKVEFSPSHKEMGGIQIKTEISFVKGQKVKDSATQTINENQLELFDGEKTEASTATH